MAIVEILGGPTPYREALVTRLERQGHVAYENSLTDARQAASDVAVIYCGPEDSWAAAAEESPDQPVVVVLAELDPDLYARALTMGAGVVHIDVSTEILVSVIEATLNGEAVVPLVIAQKLGASWIPKIEMSALTPLEVQLGEALVEGVALHQLADRLSYSDRTIRRKLQGLYIKLGVADRAGAIRALS